MINNGQLTGALSVDLIKSTIVNADLGLTRMQIGALMAETKEDENGMVDYQQFSQNTSTMIAAIVNMEIQASKAEEIKAHRSSDSYAYISNLDAESFFGLLAVNFEGKPIAMSRGQIREILENIPELESKQVNALLTLLNGPDEENNYNYADLIDYGFYTLQYLAEQDNVYT